MNNFFLAIVLGIMSASALATEVSPLTTILEVQSYPEYGGGDVIIKTTDKIDNGICDGYWLSPNSPGFASNLSIILSAFHSGSKFRIWGFVESNNKWGGSSIHFCKIYSIEATK